MINVLHSIGYGIFATIISCIPLGAILAMSKSRTKRADAKYLAYAAWMIGFSVFLVTI
jgi:hypothetical protein